MPVTGHFHADKTGLFKGFILTPKFYFRHHQTFVVAMEFIHLEGMSAERNKIPVLVYHPRLAQQHELPRLLKRYFLLEFIAGQTAVM